ncbi:MAG: hypothetical protein F6J93_31355 [Oscillatoria sp. SIO1A7]|nr:hypothetical protein [Oscillatoria sp. SIO1A7]
MDAQQYEIEKESIQSDIRNQQIYQLKNKRRIERLKSRASDVNVEAAKELLPQAQARLQAERTKTKTAQTRLEIERQGLRKTEAALVAARKVADLAEANSRSMPGTFRGVNLAGLLPEFIRAGE